MRHAEGAGTDRHRTRRRSPRRPTATPSSTLRRRAVDPDDGHPVAPCSHDRAVHALTSLRRLEVMAMTLHGTSTSGHRVAVAILSVILLILACHPMADAEVTSLTLSSDPGDYVGGGQFFFLTPSDGTFTAQQNFDHGVSVAFHTPSFDQFWYLDFAAPD